MKLGWGFDEKLEKEEEEEVEEGRGGGGEEEEEEEERNEPFGLKTCAGDAGSDNSSILRFCDRLP